MIGLLKAETRSLTQIVQKERICEQLAHYDPARLPTPTIRDRDHRHLQIQPARA